MKTIKDYRNLYVKFETFRNICLENYGFCPSHYLSTAATSLDATLSITKVELDLISNINIYLFFEKGITDGVSYISERYIKANNKYLTSSDPKKPTKYITYFDKNKLYDYAMWKSLPTDGFKWLDPIKFNLDEYEDENLRSCVLKVDLKYPKELHEPRNDYLLAPDKLQIKTELSDFQFQIINDFNISIDHVKKLVPNFFQKEKYDIHYKSSVLKSK